MKFNSFFKFCMLGLIDLAYCTSKTSFYGDSGNGPSSSRLPACGRESNYSTNYFIALNKHQYDGSKSSGTFPSSYCNKCILITYGSKYVVGVIVDRCPGCSSDGGIDVSPTIFKKLENPSKGIIYVDWEETSCSRLGESGSCDGTCRPGELSGESKKTTKKTTTTTTSKTTTTTSVKPLTTTTTLISPTEIIMNIDSHNETNIADNSTETISTTPLIQSIDINTYNDGTGIENNGTLYNPVVHKNAPLTHDTVPDGEDAEDEEGSSSTYIIPIAGAFVVSGAAGIGLIYASRNSSSTDLNSLKQKFPEAFTNLKRSLTKSGTNLKRSLTKGGANLRRTFSGKKKEHVVDKVRTRQSYRQSLMAHYPGGLNKTATTPATVSVQLHDKPVYFKELPVEEVPEAPAAVAQKDSNNVDDYLLSIPKFDTSLDLEPSINMSYN